MAAEADDTVRVGGWRRGRIGRVGQLDDDTAVHPTRHGTYTTRLSAAWNIGATPNGGYAMTSALRALVDVARRPDPVSVTVHYLRPATPDADGMITTRVVRSGRSATYATATLVQDATERLTVAAVLADLSAPVSTMADPQLTVVAPDIPPPEACVDRGDLDQGIELPLLSRVEVRVRPDGRAPATVDGWVRLRDGSSPASTTLPLFADAFPPALHATVGRVGWVPTLELTVHVRRRPQPGWVQAHITCDDVAAGMMIETGTLWDSSGALVARSRQLGMLLARE
jgi:acyl-CoA thioesterase